MICCVFPYGIRENAGLARKTTEASRWYLDAFQTIQTIQTNKKQTLHNNTYQH
jgi:hypothetical protein